MWVAQRANLKTQRKGQNWHHEREFAIFSLSKGREQKAQGRCHPQVLNVPHRKLTLAGGERRAGRIRGKTNERPKRQVHIKPIVLGAWGFPTKHQVESQKQSQCQGHSRGTRRTSENLREKTSQGKYLQHTQWWVTIFNVQRVLTNQ